MAWPNRYTDHQASSLSQFPDFWMEGQGFHLFHWKAVHAEAGWEQCLQVDAISKYFR